ncbi:hypothetical protein BIFBIF_02021 [Bifidobacterium bifidum ATCC 29521 = JCM 1255 = DSM 20456]|nr:hypothetical protein BIFBIF_02021 [Bifidobacterium bifidum ATCC 29521 = JCM 1255 = DSM 20456]
MCGTRLCDGIDPCNAFPPLFHISRGMFHNVRFHDRRRFFKIPGNPRDVLHR